MRSNKMCTPRKLLLYLQGGSREDRSERTSPHVDGGVNLCRAVLCRLETTGHLDLRTGPRCRWRANACACRRRRDRGAEARTRVDTADKLV